MLSQPLSRAFGSNAKQMVMEAMRTDPALAEAFMARLARQLQELRARMELRNIRFARDRVLQYLRLRAGSHGRSTAIEGQLQDIATEIGMTREALYRTLAPLEAERLLTRTETPRSCSRNLTAHDPDHAGP